jgi:hypothetical protein
VVKPVRKAQHASDNFKAMRIETIAVDMLGQGDIPAGIECGQQVEALEHKTNFVAAQFGALAVAHRGKIVAVEENMPASCLRQPADHVEQGRLPATRRPHDGHKFAREHFHVHAAERQHLKLAGAIDLPQILGFEYRLQDRLPGGVRRICRQKYSSRDCHS